MPCRCGTFISDMAHENPPNGGQIRSDPLLLLSKPEETLHRSRGRAQRLKALAALVEDLGSIPSDHVVAHNHP